MAGGIVPKHMLGTSLEEYIHIADIYATLISFGGGSAAYTVDTVAAEYDLPPIDSINMKDYLTGVTTTSPRTEIHLSSQALIVGNYKIIVGAEPSVMWQGPIYPNNTGVQPVFPDPVYRSVIPGNRIYYDCGTGCLFDIYSDPTEHNDLSQSMPTLFNQLLSRLAVLNETLFLPDRGTDSPQACEYASSCYAGYYGPFVNLTDSIVTCPFGPLPQI